MRLGVFPAVIVLFVATRAEAQNNAPAAPLGPAQLAPASPRTERILTDGSVSTEKAAEHFGRALAWYRAGKYRRALQELDAAIVRDPDGKDLVFNLALVQEKLGDLSGAITSLRRFQSMEKDPKELERAGQTIARLEGALAELQASASPGVEPSEIRVAPGPEPRLRGKLDGWVIGTGALSLASLVVGTVFGVRALTMDDSDQSRVRDAAILADVALTTGLLSGAGSFALYFGRFAEGPPHEGATQQAVLPQPLPSEALARIEFRY